MKEKDLASEIISKLVFIIVLLIAVLLSTNIMWLWYINQYEFVTQEVEQEANNNNTTTITQTGVGK